MPAEQVAPLPKSGRNSSRSCAGLAPWLPCPIRHQRLAAERSGLWAHGLIRFQSQHLDRRLGELEGAVIGEQRITAPVDSRRQMDRIRRLQAGGSAQFRGPLHHLRMQGHHAAIGEKAAVDEVFSEGVGEQADLIQPCAADRPGIPCAPDR